MTCTPESAIHRTALATEPEWLCRQVYGRLGEDRTRFTGKPGGAGSSPLSMDSFREDDRPSGGRMGFVWPCAIPGLKAKDTHTHTHVSRL